MPEPAPDVVVHRLAVCGSTQEEARRLRGTGAGAPFAVATREQVRGRGRLDRVWVTPPGGGIALTLAHRCAAPLEERSWYPLVAGLAVIDAIGEILGSPVAAQVGLKWPNDVLGADGRKLAGILMEADGPDHLLIGVGMNVVGPVRTGAGEEVPTAAWLIGPDGIAGDAPGVSGDPSVTVRRLEDALARNLEAQLSRLDATRGDAVAAGMRERYAMRCVTLGAAVRVEPLVESGAHEVRIGRAAAVDAQGRLVLEGDRGERTAIGTGEVRRVRPADAQALHHPRPQEEES